MPGERQRHICTVEEWVRQMFIMMEDKDCQRVMEDGSDNPLKGSQETFFFGNSL